MTSEARMQSMMKLLHRVTDGKGSNIFLFKTFPAFTSYEKPPQPGGHIAYRAVASRRILPFSLLRNNS
jgi:hypothetical protein